MSNRFTKIAALFLCLLLIFEQSGFAQIAGELDISTHLLALRNSLTQDKFRPLHLRYLSYDSLNNNFKLLLDKGDAFTNSTNSTNVTNTTKDLLNYFFIGLSLPNESFWVNLRPDSPDNIIDDALAQTDIGKILLEADLQLKKDTASFTSPQTPEGKLYWDRLYKKAEELFGYENITIPTLTRPWIVPGEIIIRESQDSAYIYKATLKVMLEADYLKAEDSRLKAEGEILSIEPTAYSFSDPRLKALNEYSTQLIRELVIPKLTKDVNTSKRYAPLRQVYYSLILAQWFKARLRESSEQASGRAGLNLPYQKLIDSRNLTGLTSKTSCSKDTYFNEYKRSFAEGEYNLKEPVYTPYGQSIRSYMSGGIILGGQEVSSAINANRLQGNRSIDILRAFGLSSRLGFIPGSFDPVTGTVRIEESLSNKNVPSSDWTLNNGRLNFSDGAEVYNQHTRRAQLEFSESGLDLSKVNPNEDIEWVRKKIIYWQGSLKRAKTDRNNPSGIKGRFRGIISALNKIKTWLNFKYIGFILVSVVLFNNTFIFPYITFVHKEHIEETVLVSLRNIVGEYFYLELIKKNPQQAIRVFEYYRQLPNAEELLQQAYKALAQEDPVSAIELYDFVREYLSNAESLLAAVVETVAQRDPVVVFGLCDFLKGRLPNAELFLRQVAETWAQEDPLGALRFFNSYKHLIEEAAFLQQIYKATVKLISQSDYADERLLSEFLDERADLRDHFLRFLDKTVEKFAQPSSIRPEDFNALIFALKLKGMQRLADIKSKLVKILYDFAMKTDIQELRILYSFSILNGIERMDSNEKDFLNRQYPEIMDNLKFLKPNESLPYKDIFGRKNPNKEFNIGAYIPLHPHFYREMFVNGLGLAEQGKGDRSTFSGMLNGKKVTIYLDSSGDPKDYQVGIFKNVSGHSINIIVFAGHTGMGAALGLALDKSPDIDYLVDATPAFIVLSCDSAKVYSGEIRKRYPYSQGVYLTTDTNTGVSVAALKEMILDITNEETWPQIADKVRDIDPTIGFIFPHESLSVFSREGYYIPISGVMLLAENDVFKFDPAYIKFSDIVSTKAVEVIQKALYFFHWNSVLKSMSKNIEAGGFAQPLADEQDVYLITKQAGADGQDRYTVTLNLGYRNSSKSTLTMMLLYELNEYFSKTVINKNGEITVFDRLRGLQLVAEFVKTHHKEHLFSDFLQKYGYEIDNIPLELLQRTLDNNDIATRTKALNELLKKMGYRQVIGEEKLKSQGLLSFYPHPALSETQFASTGWRGKEIADAASSSLENRYGSNSSLTSASQLSAPSHLRGATSGATLSHLVGGKGWVIALTAMLIGAIFYPAGISKEPKIEQPRIIEAQKEPLDIKIQKRIDSVTHYVLHKTPLAAKQAFRETISDVKKYIPYLAGDVSETDLRIIAGIEDESGSIESRSAKNALGPMQVKEIAFRDLLLFADALANKVKKGVNSKEELGQYRFFKKIGDRYKQHRNLPWKDTVKKIGLRGNYKLGAAIHIKNLITARKMRETNPRLSKLSMKHSAVSFYNAGQGWIFRWLELPADTKNYLKIIEGVEKNIEEIGKIAKPQNSSSALISSSPVHNLKETQALRSLEEILSSLSLDLSANLETGKEAIGLFNQLPTQERIRIFGRILKNDYGLEKKEANKLLFPFGYNLWKDIADRFSYAFSEPQELPLLAGLLNREDIPKEAKVYVWKILERSSEDNPLKVLEALDAGGIRANRLLAMAMAPGKEAGTVADIAADIVFKLLNTQQERAVVVARQYAYVVLSFARGSLRNNRVFDSRLIEPVLAFFEPLSALGQIPLRQQAPEEVIKRYIDQLLIINDIFQGALKVIHENPDISYAEFYERLMGGEAMQERLAYLTSSQRVMIKAALMQSRLDRLVWRNEFAQARKDYPIDEFSRLSSEIFGLYKQRNEYTRAYNKVDWEMNLAISALEARLFNLRKAVAPYIEKTFGIAAKDAPDIAVIKLGDFGPEAYLESKSLQRAIHSNPETLKDAVSDALKEEMKVSLVKDKAVNKEVLYSLFNKFASYVFADLQDEMVAYLVGAMLRYRDFDEQVLDRYMNEYLDALRKYLQKEDWFKHSGLTENDILQLINEIRLDPESKWQKTKLALKETKQLLDDLVDAKATLIYYEMQGQNPDLANSQEFKDRAYEQASFYILGIFQLVPILKTYRLKSLLARLRKDLAEKGLFGKDILHVAITQSNKPYKEEDFVWVGFAKGNAIVAEIGSEENVIRHERQHLIFDLYTGKEARRLTPGFNDFVRIMRKTAAEENTAESASLAPDTQNGLGYNYGAGGLSVSRGENNKNSVSSPAEENVSSYDKVPFISPQKEIIGSVVMPDGGRLNMRIGKDDKKGRISVVFFDESDKQIGFIDVYPDKFLINYLDVQGDERSKGYSTAMLGAVLKGLKEGRLTGKNQAYFIVYLRNPLLGKTITDYGFVPNLKYVPELITKVLISKTKNQNNKFPLYVEVPKNRMNIEEYINNEPYWQANFEVVLDKPQNSEEVYIFTSYYQSNPDKISEKLSAEKIEVSFEPPFAGSPIISHAPTDKGGIDTSIRQADKAQVPLSINSPINKETGGIDLRALPAVREPVLNSSSPALSPQPRALNPVLGNEWGKIQSLLNAGIIPSGQRLVGYISSCLKDGVYVQESDKILGSVADILRIQEERVEPAENGFSNLLILLESDKPSQELELALTTIEFAAKEPKTIEPYNCNAPVNGGRRNGL